MPNITLHDGREVLVGLRHGWTSTGRRETTAWCRFLSTGHHVQAAAVCSLQDNFCRRTGRRLAVNRLMLKLRAPQIESELGDPILDRDSRRQVFQALTPEFGQQSRAEVKV